MRRVRVRTARSV